MFPSIHVNGNSQRFLTALFSFTAVALTAIPVHAGSGKSGFLKTIRFMIEDILTMGSFPAPGSGCVAS